MPKACSPRSLPHGAAHRWLRFCAVARSILVRCLAVYCLTVSAPGASEVVEDLLQFVGSGHTVHCSSEHQDEPEHGCSGFFHVCQCCSQAQALPSVAVAAVQAARCARRQPLPIAAGEALPGYRAPPFRPPTV
jgi:hypothetical protein